MVQSVRDTNRQSHMESFAEDYVSFKSLTRLSLKTDKAVRPVRKGILEMCIMFGGAKRKEGILAQILQKFSPESQVM
jgi:hypothetical protein